jgi:NAD(P)-dependent dehydrogenase (short-subunit alcohol dehydrogenase family)
VAVEASLLKDRVALVTGGGSGIGRAACMALARAGARVVLGNRDADAGMAVVGEIQQLGGQAAFRATDVRDSSAVAALVDFAVERFGGLHIAFNNAGFGSFAPLHQTDDGEAQRLLEVNVLGVFYAMKHEIRVMLENPADARGEGRGVIVNCCSIFGLGGFKSMSLYAASKHAVAGLTRSAALDYAQSGIRINAVAPGPIQTPALGPSPQMFSSYVPMGRLGQPQEVADAVVWLATPQAAYITGHVLPMDGGVTAACDPADSVAGGDS